MEQNLSNILRGRLTLSTPDSFYWTNRAFPVTDTGIDCTGDETESSRQADMGKLRVSPRILQWAAIIWPGLNEWTSRYASGINAQHLCGTDGDQVTETASPFHSFNSEEYHRFHSQSPIPQLLNASRFLLLTSLNLLTNKLLARKPVTVYMNAEYCELDPKDLTLLPLDKAKTQYIAVQRDVLESMHDMVCYDRDVVEYAYHLNDSAYKSIVTGTRPAVIQEQFQQRQSTARRTQKAMAGRETKNKVKKLRPKRSSHLKVKRESSRESISIKFGSTGDLSTSEKAKPSRFKGGQGTASKASNLLQPTPGHQTLLKRSSAPGDLLRVDKKDDKVYKNASKNVIAGTKLSVTHSPPSKASGVAHELSSSNEAQSVKPKTSMPGKKGKIYYIPKDAPDRPLRKMGEAKFKVNTVPCQETGTSSSSLKFSRESSALNVLRKYAHQHSLEVILPTSHVSSDKLQSFAERVTRDVASSQARSASHQQPTSVRHRVRQQYMEDHQSRTVALTRDVVDRDCARVVLTHLPFDSKEITQLLHASDYSKIVQQVGDPSTSLKSDEYIPSHFIVGVAYFKMSKYSDAREHFKKCESVAKETGRDSDVMLCNAYLGDIEYASQNYTQAAQFYKTAIKHHAPGNVAAMFKLTPPSLSAVNAKLASSYRNASMMVQAIQHYKTAISEAKTDRDRLSAHTSLGNLYQSMGDNGNALEQYKESIKLAEKLSDYVSLGWAYGNIGNAYLGLNRKDEAVYHLQKSLDLAVDYERTPQAIGRTYNNLGTAYQSMSNLDKAEEFYDLALSQAIYGDDKPGQARVYGNIGNVYMLRKNYERAIPHYSEVLSLSRDASTINTARHNRGCAYYDWGTSLYRERVPINSAAPDYQCDVHNSECDIDKCLRELPYKAKEYFRKGSDDLKEVVDFHEERLQHIKGSSKGLTLSVSLFESNSRTFHRLQDCLVSLHRFDEALVVAEQSRARTLGELLLKRKGEMVEFSSPLHYEDIKLILKKFECPLLYFSYTGARLICWSFLPGVSGVDMKSFEIPLAEDQFNGKSFDHLLRFSLTENLVERSFEMYQAIRYSEEESNSEVQALYRLVGAPTLKILREKDRTSMSKTSQKVTTISDSYTSLLPLTCLFDNESKSSFLGDRFFFNQIPSLMTMGVINQSPDITVDLEGDSRDFCIVGDPNIPPFYHNGELWSLGRLPHAKKEAEWVAHALNTTPVLGDQATKSSLLIRLMNAKVVHIATHGSASAGFLAFSSFAVHAHEGLAGRNQVHGSNVLLYPEDVEKLTFASQHPALVVLSSCDSGRGVVKADGIQGMARAFILAGAQSVLTTLWKIPDESASVFMQFFYQYLLDEMRSSLALQKAILSVRCFAKYSQYIHWSGYQLTGRDIQFISKPNPSSMTLKQRLGEPSVFPRLASIKKLQNAIINGPCLPTDVQIVKGCPGVDPAEVVIDFISSFHMKFPAGIFWINCGSPEMVSSGVKRIEKVIGKDLSDLSLSEIQHALFVFDNMIHVQLPELENLLKLLKSKYIHVIVVSTATESPHNLVKEVDRKLLRGCTIHNIEPLTKIHSTQRIVHSLLKKQEVTPSNADQEMFEKMAEVACGSPVIVDIASEVVTSRYEQYGSEAVVHLNDILSLDHQESSEQGTSSGEFYMTDSDYDSWDSVMNLIDECDLSMEERLLLNCVSIFGCTPVPFTLLTEMSSLIAQTSRSVHLAGSLHQKLFQHSLLKAYPQQLVFHPKLNDQVPNDTTSKFVCVPQLVSRSLWSQMMDVDKVVVLSIAYATVSTLRNNSGDYDISGLCSILVQLFEQNYDLVGENCYQQLYSLYLSCRKL